MNNAVKETIEQINKYNDIYIASHVQPDGDNIGSILALGLALKKLNKKVHIIKTDDIPTDYLFLPGIEDIQDYDLEEIELLIILDCSDIDRLGKYKNLIPKAKTIVNVDHHVSNTIFGNYNIIDANASATGELVYNLITKLEIPLDKEIATCLYTAISTDTGRFMYDSVSDKTHEIIAELIRTGMDRTDININLYQSRSMERTNLFIDSFSTLKTYNNDKIATVKVTQEMIKKANAKMEDSEGIISFIRDIECVEVACLLKEFEDKVIKIGLRSKKHIDVASICATLNGGGHIRAAGCTVYESIDDAEKIIIEQIMKAFR